VSDQITIAHDTAVYDEDDNKLGVVTGSTTDGFTVSVVDDVEFAGESAQTDGASSSEADRSEAVDEGNQDIDPQEHNPGQEFGEGYIMWRCNDCGEMGELDDGLPEECPTCGSEEVYKFKED
jgi:rubrerythrin